jgi:hypothetical protein
VIHRVDPSFKMWFTFVDSREQIRMLSIGFQGITLTIFFQKIHNFLRVGQLKIKVILTVVEKTAYYHKVAEWHLLGL